MESIHSKTQIYFANEKQLLCCLLLASATVDSGLDSFEHCTFVPKYTIEHSIAILCLKCKFYHDNSQDIFIMVMDMTMLIYLVLAE